MGIVNLTPDSFSDGGKLSTLVAALKHAERLLKEGACILDVGGESTRPGSTAVPADEEWARIEGFLQEVVGWKVPLSVDTYKTETMRRALDTGVDIVNDIRALQMPGAVDVVTGHPLCGVCLMHMHRDPQTMQISPMQGDVVPAVVDFLKQRTIDLSRRGVVPSRIVLDCGIGFGKTIEQNFSLLIRQQEILKLGFPVLAGWSRKSSLGAALACLGEVPEPDRRVMASVSAALMSVERGARIVRVHDVKETAEALSVWRHAMSVSGQSSGD